MTTKTVAKKWRNPFKNWTASHYFYSILSTIILILLLMAGLPREDSLFRALVEHPIWSNLEGSFSSTMAALLTGTHVSLFIISYLAYVLIIIYGDQAWLSALYQAVLTFCQVVYDGCILTSAQNFFYAQVGLPLLPNGFIAETVLPGTALMLRLVMLVLISIYTWPTIKMLRNRWRQQPA